MPGKFCVSLTHAKDNADKATESPFRDGFQHLRPAGAAVGTREGACGPRPRLHPDGMHRTMNPANQHPLAPDVRFDGGDMDCGGGLLLLIRRHIDPMPRGGLLEILSEDSSVEQDLPSWCRLTGNDLVSWTK